MTKRPDTNSPLETGGTPSVLPRPDFRFPGEMDVGMDVGSPVDSTYKLPFAFTGKIEKVTVKLGELDIGSAKTGKE